MSPSDDRPYWDEQDTMDYLDFVAEQERIDAMYESWAETIEDDDPPFDTLVHPYED